MLCCNTGHEAPARYHVQDGDVKVLLVCLQCMETLRDMGLKDEDIARIPYPVGKEPA
jgi:hypothetical protein